MAEGDKSHQAMVVVAKVVLDKAQKARDKVQEQVDMLSMQIFQLCGNLLTDEACQPWEKIVKVETETITWEDLCREVNEKKAGKP